MITPWLLLLVAWLAAPVQDATPGPETFAMRVVTTDLASPWQMRLAPDGRLWVTERAGARVVRINPADGSKSTVLTIPNVVQHHQQDGVLGMAFHPGFLAGRDTDFVYIAFTYDADPGPAETRRMKVRRFVYFKSTETLGSATDVITDLPAGDDHVSGRLIMGRDQKLYLTVGDGGFNQLARYCLPIHAQEIPTAAEVRARDWHHYEGKVLRINLDGSIPLDNPVFGGVLSHIFSNGHRNAQGLVAAPDGKIYASEHGPSMDDELNLIQAGKNYGWPYVAGYKDDRVYVYANWSASTPEPCASLKWDAIVAPPSVPQQKESAWNDASFMPPIRTFFTVGADYKFTEAGNATIAPSGIDVYTVASGASGGIPGWANSVLVASLIRGAVYRVKLSASGTAAVGTPTEYFKGRDRYRDVLVGPDGKTIYVATDVGNQDHPGAILEFTYQPTPGR